MERDQALQQLDALADQIAPYGVPIMPLVAVDARPPEVIVDEAASHRADMIVMAIHGGSERAGWALGGGVDEVLHIITTPLLLVPVHPHGS